MNSTRLPAGRRLTLAALVGATMFAVALTGCTAAPEAGASVEGGSFTIAALGGGSAETLNPGLMNGDASIARNFQIFEPLVTIGSGDELVEYVLAESLTANEDASVWTLKLRDDVTWHDGSPLTADDVIYTITYSKEQANYAGNVYSNVDEANLVKVDDLTVEIPLQSPSFLFPEVLVDINALIWKNGTTDWTHPVGTGPFVLESFTPGQTATFSANDDYWGGAPQIDELEIMSIDDPTARINALQSGQVDAIAGVPFSGIAQLESAGNTIQNQVGGSWVGIRMNTRLAPFDDARVREAMKLLVDREQVVSNAMGGNGAVANDLFGFFDPNFASDLPQREYDPERAKELLAEAGYEDLELTLTTTDLGSGSTETATLLAASAAEAGVKIEVDVVPLAEFYSLPWKELQWAPTSWSARSIATQMSNQMSRAAIEADMSEGGWANEEFLTLFDDAIAESDDELRRELLIEAQKLAWEEGPYIIPAMPNIITATGSRVNGIESGIRTAFGDWDFTSVTVD